jgi:hypothetical protein
MTLTTLIALNAVLAALVVYGIVRLLAVGIRSDRQARTDLHATLLTLTLPQEERQKIAA